MSFEEAEEVEGNSEHRNERRWNIPIPVSVKGIGSDGTGFNEESITADASPRGMCLLLTQNVQEGDQVTVTAPEEGFTSQATVRVVSSLGPYMNRVRVVFPRGTKFSRDQAAKKYVYDFNSGNWVGYILGDTYYDTKFEPFGKVEINRIVSQDSGAILFRIRANAVYDERGNCIGHLI